MRQNYCFLLVFLFFQMSFYGQNHTHIYSKAAGGSAYAGPINELSDFSSCQTAVSANINGFNWAGWAVTYDLQVNGVTIATNLAGQYTFDLTQYIPVSNVKMIATSGNGWIDMLATINVSSPEATMPASVPAVSNITYAYGSAATPLTATLTGNGTTLKWYAAATGDVASFTAPIPATATSGVTTYWVSQAEVSGCESLRVPLQVTIAAPANTVHVVDEQCGATLTSANSYVYANLVKNAQAYRFRVTDLSTGEVQTKDYVLRNLMLSNMSFFKYNQEYKIEVAVKRNNAWSDFGLPCNVSTPMAFTKVSQSQCGGMINDRDDYVYADLVSYAKGYRFYIMNWNTGSSQMYDSTLRAFKFANVQDFTPATTYSIYVSVQNTDGNYLPFGQECTVTTAGNGNGELMKVVADNAAGESRFEVSAYPNPFSQEFKLAIRTNSTSAISVKVYDMMGRLIEDKKYDGSEAIENIVLGANINNSGIYNVIVSQDDKVETLRMIKR